MHMHSLIASKEWGGLMKSYYGYRWATWLEMFEKNYENWSLENQKAAYYKILPFESHFQTAFDEIFPTEPIGDTVEIACTLYVKWNIFGDNKCE